MPCGGVCTDLYQGAGYVWVGDSTNNRLRILGNTQQLQLSHTTEEENVRDFTSPAGGNCFTNVTIDSIAMVLDVFDFSACNLRLALVGQEGEVAAGTSIASEVIAVDDLDVMYPFGYLADEAQASPSPARVARRRMSSIRTTRSPRASRVSCRCLQAPSPLVTSRQTTKPKARL